MFALLLETCIAIKCSLHATFEVHRVLSRTILRCVTLAVQYSVPPILHHVRQSMNVFGCAMDPATGKAAYESPTKAWKPQKAVGRQSAKRALQGTAVHWSCSQGTGGPTATATAIVYSDLLCCFAGSKRRSHSGTANLIINSLVSSAAS
jgi:hypothetical protein